MLHCFGEVSCQFSKLLLGFRVTVLGMYVIRAPGKRVAWQRMIWTQWLPYDVAKFKQHRASRIHGHGTLLPGAPPITL